MREFARNYDHCFLGNGTDGVLVGYTGAMVPERVNSPERCGWYKSDRYYPPERPAMPVPHRHYRKEVTRVPRPDDTWFELAPLGRSWYEVLGPDGRPDPVVGFDQQFDPKAAVLRSRVRFAAASAEVTTFLHARLPLLVVRCRFDREVHVRAQLGPGPWATSEDEPEPFTELVLQDGDPATVRYRLGTLAGEQALWLDAPAERHEREGRRVWLERTCRRLTMFHAIVDDRDRTTLADVIAHANEVGFDGLLAEHAEVWRGYRVRSSVTVPEPKLQRLYDAGLTLFRAIQSPESGGIPVGLLRQTWSSHLFWDAYFPTRALLEANQVGAARAQCGFLLRTADLAREHARRTFGVDGLAWDWELTHDGRRAYGEDWAHLAEQVHNTAAYSNLLFDTWRFTRDDAFLAEVEPILGGIAEFFIGAVVEQREDGWGTRPLVGVHESAIRVRDDAFNLAGALRALENAERAERILGGGGTGPRRAIEVGLRRALDALFDGRMFRPYAGATTLTMSSLAPIWPMEVVQAYSPSARSTARAFRRAPGFLTVGGWPRAIWPAAILARIFADQGRGRAALDVLHRCLPAMNVHGGVAEMLGEDGRWNLQYFATAHGALCSAIHAMLLGSDDVGHIRLFPALPPDWLHAAFERLLVAGIEVSATFEDGRVTRLELANPGTTPRSATMRVNGRTRSATLRPGESGVLVPSGATSGGV